MRRWKQWLYDRFLPAWCRDDLLAENAHLRARAEAQARENERLLSYIGGLETALRHQRRVIIHCKEAKTP